MQLAPPVLLAAVLAATTFTAANAQAPTKPQRSRISGGPVTVPFEPTPVAAALQAEPVVIPAEAAPINVALVVAEAVAKTAVKPAGAPRSDPVVATDSPRRHADVQVAQATTAPRVATRPRSSAATGNGGASNAVRSCTSIDVDPPTSLTLGKSRVIRLPFPATRLVVGGQPGSSVGTAGGAGRGGESLPEGNAAGAAPMGRMPAQMQQPQAQDQRGRAREDSWDGVARTDVVLLSPTELFFLGRRPGSMNVVLQGNDGRCLVKDIVVTIDPDALQAKLTELMPEENSIKVRGADDALVLTGAVTDAVKLSHVLALAGSYGDGKKVVNLLRVNSPQQVMLEVTIAEVSKTLLSKLGLDFSRMVSSANGTVGVISGIVGGAPGLLARFGGLAATGVGGSATVGSSSASGSANATAGGIDATVDNSGTHLTLKPGTISKNSSILGMDAKKNDGIVRVLAEPNIMAISGQPASFLSGGRIFIPVAQGSALGGAPTISLQEKEFGVSLKFTPTVLDGTINLKIVSEVSELSQTGSPFTTIGGVTSVLPSLTTRQVDTTIQLGDGQSFAVAGLIKNNMTEALNKFPGLGEAPVLGALFRSSEFQSDQTELMFVVTPRLVKPVTAPLTLPTDNHVPPTPNDALFRGKGEGREPPPQPTPTGEAQPTAPGPTRP